MRTKANLVIKRHRKFLNQVYPIQQNHNASDRRSQFQLRRLFASVSWREMFHYLEQQTLLHRIQSREEPETRRWTNGAERPVQSAADQAKCRDLAGAICRCNCKKSCIKKSNQILHYTRGITSKRVSGGPISAAQRLRNKAKKKHRSGDNPGIEPKTSRADSDVFNHYANWHHAVPLHFQH